MTMADSSRSSCSNGLPACSDDVCVVSHLRVVLVAPNASARFGGEAILPLHYFRHLLERGYDVQLVVHCRVQDELEQILPSAIDRMHFIPDRLLHRCLHQLGRKLPRSIAAATTTVAIDLSCQWEQRRVARQLVKKAPGPAVVHQPTPVSPKRPSLLLGLGAPVIIGPMNGGMTHPPGLARDHRPSTTLANVGRRVATLLNFVLPGKPFAAILLVANERTRAALPVGRSRARTFVENGVDLTLWDAQPVDADEPTFVFLGRLVGCKNVDILLQAFARARMQQSMRLVVVGNGPERPKLVRLAEELGISDDVEFRGFIPQHECPAIVSACRALVLPSTLECGGAVVLEAMALAKPVIAARWGGPADYLDDGCGVLIEPSSRSGLTKGLTQAMLLLARDKKGAIEMGQAGRNKVIQEYSWARKIDHIVRIYMDALRNDHPDSASRHGERARQCQ